MSEIEITLALFAVWVVLRVRRLLWWLWFVRLPVERRRAYVGRLGDE